MVLLAVRRVTTVCVTASTLSPLTSHTACTQARRQLLAEMCDPQVRVWLIYLAAYGKASVQPFLSYTQNDNLGVAFKAPRVIRDRISFLDDIASEEKDPLLHAALTELNTFVKERAASFPDVNSVRSLVRNAAAAASRYFQGEDGAASTPRKQRALRWLKHSPLLLLGLMDEKGLRKPEKIRFFRGQMQTIISRACGEIGVEPTPSRRCRAPPRSSRRTRGTTHPTPTT